MDNNWFEGMIDPYDLLQHHNQQINDLIKAYQNQERTMLELLKQNSSLSDFLVKTNRRIDILETEVKRLNNEIHNTSR
jgi:peptidoglycan hydrolase CwlO-like protein